MKKEKNKKQSRNSRRTTNEKLKRGQGQDSECKGQYKPNEKKKQENKKKREKKEKRVKGKLKKKVKRKTT